MPVEVSTTSDPSVTIDHSAAAKSAATQPPVATSASSKEPTEGDKPSWLDARLERERSTTRDRERKAVLEELGLTSVDEGKKAVSDAKAKRDAEKSAEQKAIEAAKEAETLKGQNAELRKSLSALAAEQLKGLSEEHRAAVLALAGDDAAKQITTIATLAPTWAKPAAATPAAPAKVADTAPAKTAPDGKQPPTVDHKATYQSLRKDNPVLAARYAEAHPEVYERSS